MPSIEKQIFYYIYDYFFLINFSEALELTFNFSEIQLFIIHKPLLSSFTVLEPPFELFFLSLQTYVTFRSYSNFFPKNRIIFLHVADLLAAYFHPILWLCAAFSGLQFLLQDCHERVSLTNLLPYCHFYRSFLRTYIPLRSCFLDAYFITYVCPFASIKTLRFSLPPHSSSHK